MYIFAYIYVCVYIVYLYVAYAECDCSLSTAPDRAGDTMWAAPDRTDAHPGTISSHQTSGGPIPAIRGYTIVSHPTFNPNRRRHLLEPWRQIYWSSPSFPTTTWRPDHVVVYVCAADRGRIATPDPPSSGTHCNPVLSVPPLLIRSLLGRRYATIQFGVVPFPSEFV
jgi:hypothetical protein